MLVPGEGASLMVPRQKHPSRFRPARFVLIGPQAGGRYRLHPRKHGVFIESEDLKNCDREASNAQVGF